MGCYTGEARRLSRVSSSGPLPPITIIFGLNVPPFIVGLTGGLASF